MSESTLHDIIAERDKRIRALEREKLDWMSKAAKSMAEAEALRARVEALEGEVALWREAVGLAHASGFRLGIEHRAALRARVEALETELRNSIRAAAVRESPPLDFRYEDDSAATRSTGGEDDG